MRKLLVLLSIFIGSNTLTSCKINPTESSVKEGYNLDDSFDTKLYVEISRLVNKLSRTDGRYNDLITQLLGISDPDDQINFGKQLVTKDGNTTINDVKVTNSKSGINFSIGKISHNSLELEFTIKFNFDREAQTKTYKSVTLRN